MTERFVGRFRGGRVEGNRPESLPNWLISTSDSDVAAEVTQLLGGHPEGRQIGSRTHLEIETKVNEVEIVISGPSALTVDMRLWHRRGLVHHCDGAAHLTPESARGKPCGCPQSITERKAAAKAFQGPQPHIALTFSLTGAPHLGPFLFHSMSWELAEGIQQTKQALMESNGPAIAALRLERVELKTRRGAAVFYHKPAIELQKPK
ncbi:hypothetical protein AB0G83_08640 [Streptomyces klenkii]|uniref:recombination directionality factor n=1 Tax=Streptomyces klenkii TaxID=1420899 RepID=UPI0033ED1A2A